MGEERGVERCVERGVGRYAERSAGALRGLDGDRGDAHDDAFGAADGAEVRDRRQGMAASDAEAVELQMRQSEMRGLGGRGRRRRRGHIWRCARTANAVVGTPNASLERTANAVVGTVNAVMGTVNAVVGTPNASLERTQRDGPRWQGGRRGRARKLCQRQFELRERDRSQIRTFELRERDRSQIRTFELRERDRSHRHRGPAGKVSACLEPLLVLLLPTRLQGLVAFAVAIAVAFAVAFAIAFAVAVAVAFGGLLRGLAIPNGVLARTKLTKLTKPTKLRGLAVPNGAVTMPRLRLRASIRFVIPNQAILFSNQVLRFVIPNHIASSGLLHQRRARRHRGHHLRIVLQRHRSRHCHVWPLRLRLFRHQPSLRD